MNQLSKLLVDFVKDHEKNHALKLDVLDGNVFGYVDETILFKELVNTFDGFDVKFDVKILEDEIPSYLKYGTVVVPTCDMRKFPVFESERVHQLIFNEKVKTLQIQTDYYLVKDLKSSYVGYVRASQLKFSERDSNYYNHVVVSRFAGISFKDFSVLLPFATKLEIIDETDSFYFARTALGLGKIKKTDVRLVPEFAAKDIEELMDIYISTPYLWGGTSTFGTDCSGLVYRSYDALEITVPRDTKQQLAKLHPVDRDSLSAGDLILFKGHVGIYIGNGKMVHSSASLGGVYVSNVFEPKSVYEETLRRGIIAFRRVRI